MTTFELPLNPKEPIGLYFAKQKNCISLLEDIDKSITKHRHKHTLLGHLQPIPAVQLYKLLLF